MCKCKKILCFMLLVAAAFFAGVWCYFHFEQKEKTYVGNTLVKNMKDVKENVCDICQDTKEFTKEARKFGQELSKDTKQTAVKVKETAEDICDCMKGNQNQSC